VDVNSSTLQSFETSFQQDFNHDAFIGAHAAPLPVAAGPDAFVFKADSDPAWQNGSNGLTAEAAPPSIRAELSGAGADGQPHVDLSALFAGDLHTPDGHPQPTVLSDLLSGHFIIH
jgi:hypothetical protein